MIQSLAAALDIDPTELFALDIDPQETERRSRSLAFRETGQSMRDALDAFIEDKLRELQAETFS
jgi:hypothetical protein